MAAYFAKSSDPSDLQRAVRLEPGNAEYHDKLGQYLSLIQNSPEVALPSYRAAVALNPHQAHYWFDLANDYQSLEDTERQTETMQRAISTDPTTRLGGRQSVLSSGKHAKSIARISCRH